MNSYGDYATYPNSSNSSSVHHHPSWAYGGTGASIWQIGSLGSMHPSTHTHTPATAHPPTVTVTRSTRGASSSSSSSLSVSSLHPDDVHHWSSWPNSIAAVPSSSPPASADNNKYHHYHYYHHPDHPGFDRSPPSPPPPPPPPPPEPNSNTLCMSNLEPWMDHEYASQVVRLMGWDRNTLSSLSNGDAKTTHSTITTPNPTNNPVTIKIPPPSSDSIPQHNNPGYCLITFPTAAHAASVLSSLHSLNHMDTSGAPLLMPNSSRPFNLQWASSPQLSQTLSLPNTSPAPSQPPPPPQQAVVNAISLANITNSSASSSQPQQQREYSIFVGDLAPETSNSDLVAVFRNPVLGLRNDREPKFIRPFYSCKSAKIMLDPVTGVSRGYGFVRFTDEADQQRALIEMHGLYCLSRPMRVSPATAKFKPDGNTAATVGGGNGSGGPPHQQSEKVNGNIEGSGDSATDKPPLVRSLSSPVATISSSTTQTISHPKGSNSNGSSTPDKPTTTTTSSSSSSASAKTPNSERAVQSFQVTPQILAQIEQLAAEKPSNPPAKKWNLAHIQQMATLGNFGNGSLATPSSSLYGSGGSGGNGLLDEAWNHQAQARAILGNLIGPNGEQLTSTDPYNTTVFVGGLSPLISEETLRTFFAPFGDIHYVKVPLGKHCGFVQFVRKADAERAIERMQGFPIGGSRIRLSWGRSQYKAAQAAAQAAQQAQAEHANRLAAALSSGQTQPMLHLTQEQALQLLYSLGYNPQPAASPNDSQPHFVNQTSGKFNNSKESLSIPLSRPRAYTYSHAGYNVNDRISILPSATVAGHYNAEEIISPGPGPGPGDASLSSASSSSANGVNGSNNTVTNPPLRLANLTNLTSLNNNNGGGGGGPYSSSSSSSYVPSDLVGGGGASFQASDILRNESHSPYSHAHHVAQHHHHYQSHSSSGTVSPVMMRRTPPGMQSQQQQQQTSKIIVRDGQGIEYLTSTLANLDLGNERFSSSRPTSGALRNGNGMGQGNENGNGNGIVNGGDGNSDTLTVGQVNGTTTTTFRERRPLSNSISAPLNNLTNGSAKLMFES